MYSVAELRVYIFFVNLPLKFARSSSPSFKKKSHLCF